MKSKGNKMVMTLKEIQNFASSIFFQRDKSLLLLLDSERKNNSVRIRPVHSRAVSTTNQVVRYSGLQRGMKTEDKKKRWKILNALEKAATNRFLTLSEISCVGKCGYRGKYTFGTGVVCL